MGAIRAEMYSDAGLGVDTTWLSDQVEHCFSLLEPLSPAPTRELCLETTFGWTAYFSNGARGSDPALPMLQLSEALGVTALRACVTQTKALYPGVILEVFDTPQAGGDRNGYRRSIAATNDGGRWVFEQSGETYDFEDTVPYSARLKRDRFTPDMLYRYLECLGIPRLTDASLQPGRTSKGLLLSRPTHDHLPKYSLEEAKDL